MPSYSHKNKIPGPLPHEIKLSNGKTRTDVSTFTDEELAEAGYVLAPEKPLINRSQKLEWNETEWIIKDKTDADKTDEWRNIQEVCIKILQMTDFKVLKCYENNIPVDPRLVAYRQAIRDVYNNINNINPWDLVWPVKPDME
jgi:hypothetical protein